MKTMSKRPTIRDVAAEAGVSKSLVSLAYSSPNSVSEQRKAKILQAAEKLGYAPNFLARSLAADSGTFIAILIADLHNPLFVEIADQVRVRLESEGRHYYITSAMIRNEDGVPYFLFRIKFLSIPQQAECLASHFVQNGQRQFQCLCFFAHNGASGASSSCLRL